MVGTALYVAAQSFRPVAGSTNSMWEWGTELASFDLSNPEAPVKRSSLWFSGYGNVVSATDTYFFAAVQDVSNWWQSIVHIVILSGALLVRPHRRALFSQLIDRRHSNEFQN